MFKMGKWIKDEKGQSLILVAICMTLFLAMAAISVDAGYLFFQKRNMQTAADAAALAGARELLSEDVDGNAVFSQVVDYVEAHNIAENEIFNEGQIKALTRDDSFVTVELKGSRGVFFARIFDLTSASVSARATAMVGPLVSIDGGLIPIAFTWEQYQNALAGADPTFIDFHIVGAGNWGVVSFEGTGTGLTPPVVAEYIRNGYPGLVTLHDPDVYSAPGVASAGAQPEVRSAIQYRIDNEHIVFVPIVAGSASGTEWIDVVEFAAVQLTELTGVGAMTGVKGVFKHALSVGEVGGPAGDKDHGVFGVVLVE